MWWEIFVSKLRIIFMYTLYLAKNKTNGMRYKKKKKVAALFLILQVVLTGMKLKKTYTRLT